MIRTQEKNRGMSIIELTISIAIGVFVMTIIVFSISSVRMSSRDSKRVADFARLQTAIDQFYDDRGVYPQCSFNDRCTGGGGPYAHMNALEIWDYLPVIPYDPLNPFDPNNPGGLANGYGYYYARGFKKMATPNLFCTTGQPTDYILLTRLEKSSGPLIRWCGFNCNVTSCSGGTFNNNNLNYMVGS